MIVNYNVREFLEQALRSLQRSLKHISHEIFVVDNNSVDGSVAMVQEAFPEVNLVANKSNPGFARANNQALRQAKGEYLFVLNPDTIVEEDTVSVLVGFLDSHPDCGAIGCRILNPDGTFALESRRAFPTPQVAFYRMTGMSRLFPKSRRFGQYNMTWLPNDRVVEVDALSGSCMMVRKGALLYSASEYQSLPADAVEQLSSVDMASLPSQNGAGLMDEGFFMYGEDLDWCYRLQQAGWRIYYTPKTQIIHYKGESTKKGDLKYVRLFYGAMLRFAEKHLIEDYPRTFLWALRTGVLLRGGMSALMSGLRHRALLDFVLLYLVMFGLSIFRAIQTQFTFPDVFFVTIVPLFAAIATVTIAALGGYQGKHPRLGAVAIGVLVSVVTLSVLSFFLKQIAFSRAVVAASLPAGILILSSVRMLWQTRRRLRRRTLVIGHPEEVHNVETILAKQPRPLFGVIGFIPTEEPYTANGMPNAPVLGSIEQLRDVVRIHKVEDVVFASSSLSNKQIFALMQGLSDLPVQSRILAEHHSHVIGKASVSYLEGATILKAEQALGVLRSRTARRVSDTIAALVVACLHPVMRLGRSVYGLESIWAALEKRTRCWHDVLSGQMALVGYRKSDAFVPPAEWHLETGMFAVSETLGPRLRRPPEEIEQAYWYYVRHQSALLDWIIAFRAIRAML